MKRNYYIVALIMLTFFVISFLTNVIGPLIPDIIKGFSLSLTLVAVLPFAFFIAYGVMSIPSGMLIEKYHEKKIMIAAFVVAFFGSLLLGFIYGAALRKGGIDENWKLFLGTGLCGGFTTFSAFALENFNMLPQKGYLALIYILLSVIVGIVAVAAGYWLAKISLS